VRNRANKHAKKINDKGQSIEQSQPPVLSNIFYKCKIMKGWKWLMAAVALVVVMVGVVVNSLSGEGFRSDCQKCHYSCHLRNVSRPDLRRVNCAHACKNKCP